MEFARGSDDPIGAMVSELVVGAGGDEGRVVDGARQTWAVRTGFGEDR